MRIIKPVRDKLLKKSERLANFAFHLPYFY